MNYLAHFYLSGDQEHLLIGNFIADSVKGKQIELFANDWQRGITMHRNIDFFTDTHAITSRSKDRLRAEFNHYSGIIVDVFYDHFLAKNWNEFSREPLENYSERIYSLLEKHTENFPERPRTMLPFMKKHNWLKSYSEIEGIRHVLSGMSRRVREGSKMEMATHALEKNYDAFEKDFREFFPQLILFTEDFRINN
jgi:acyl carrier protein phosphodiesterase